MVLGLSQHAAHPSNRSSIDAGATGSLLLSRAEEQVRRIRRHLVKKPGGVADGKQGCEGLPPGEVAGSLDGEQARGGSSECQVEQAVHRTGEPQVQWRWSRFIVDESDDGVRAGTSGVTRCVEDVQGDDFYSFCVRVISRRDGDVGRE